MDTDDNDNDGDTLLNFIYLNYFHDHSTHHHHDVSKTHCAGWSQTMIAVPLMQIIIGFDCFATKHITIHQQFYLVQTKSK